MGIYTRSWYRDSPPPGRSSGLSSSGRSGLYLLIGANVVMFVLSAILTKSGWDPSERGLGLVPDDVIRRFMIWEIVTSMFLHADLWHLLINMLVLFMFGAGVERRLGRGPFLRLYFGAGILAGLAYILFGLFDARFRPAVGASGGVMGVLVYFTLLNPNARILFLMFIPMKMKWATAILLGMDLYWFVFAPTTGTGIAHTAHLGGALFGLLYYRYSHRLDLLFLNLELKGKRKESSRDSGERDRLRAEVDRLLDKVNRGGIDSLSDREKKSLHRASERLRELSP
jgi:rhomboid family protein